MEVHKHPHHVTHKKKWSEYFLEFFMLFLAVFLGFLAENWREHLVEKERAKVLAQSLYADLKKDTVELQRDIRFSSSKATAADSIISMLHQPRNKWHDTAFYRSLTEIATINPFIATQGTYQQMKASGSLRYFKQSLVNLMNAYDVQISRTALRDEIDERHNQDKVAVFAYDAFNIEILFDMRLGKPITHPLYMNLADANAVNKFINLIAAAKVMAVRSTMEYNEQLKIGEQLIEELKKEFRLDE